MTKLVRGITTSAGFKKALEEKVPEATVEASMTAGALLDVFKEIDENITFKSNDDRILEAVNGEQPTPTVYAKVDFNIAADEDLLGKVVADLQKDVTVSEDSIDGELLYVEDYTEFSGDPELQEGNYLALHVDTNSTEDVYVELVNGISGPVKLDSDRIIILRVVDASTQSIKVTTGDLVAAYSFGELILDTKTEEPGQ